MQKSEKVAVVKNNIRQIAEKTRRKRVYGCLIEISYYLNTKIDMVIQILITIFFSVNMMQIFEKVAVKFSILKKSLFLWHNLSRCR